MDDSEKHILTPKIRQKFNMSKKENIFKDSEKNSTNSFYPDSLMKNDENFLSKEFDFDGDNRNYWPTKLTNFICMFLDEKFSNHLLNFEEIIDVYNKITFDSDFKQRISNVSFLCLNYQIYSIFCKLITSSFKLYYFIFIKL